MEENKKNEIIFELKEITSKQYKSMEAINLLKEGIFAFENDKYYSTLAIYSIFLEKYLRDKLIEKEKGGIDLDFDIYDKIEKQIEDELNRKGDKKNGLTFYDISEKLFGSESEENKELKRIYKDIRIPLLHGLFSRLAWNLGLNKDKNGTIFNNGEYRDKKMNESSSLLRGNHLNNILKDEAELMSKFIIELINYFEENL
ncbi:hypothetical protein EOM39_04410 [Candidatus Gracilibacteria bacterium]|nr:hypothetical protein [Candidatus Gracilibacteria bacterium]